MAEATVTQAGSAVPIDSATAQFTSPAIKPLAPATNKASVVETLRVRLLSMA